MSGMQYVVLFKKTTTATSTGNTGEDGRKIREYIESYLDETGKAQKKFNPPQFPYLTPNMGAYNGVGQHTVAAGDFRTKADDLDKDRKGDIKLYGFFRRLVFDYTGKPVDSLTNVEKAAAVEEVWRAKRKEKHPKIMAHKIVIALGLEVSKEMTEKGIPVDEQLQQVVCTTMDRYQEKFYPGHQLGYLVGIHHDRKHIHAHILLYPQTDKGKPLNVSHWSNVRMPDGTVQRVDYQGFIKSTVEQLGVEMYVNRVQRACGSYQFPEEYGIQEKLLAEAALRQIQQEMEEATPGAPLDTRTLEVKALLRKRQLMKMSDRTVRPYMELEYERRVKAWDRMTTDVAEATIKQGEASKKQLKKDIVELYREQSPDHKSGQRGYRQRRSISKDAFTAKKILLGWKMLKWGSALFTDSSDGRWWVSRMHHNDELSAMMERAHNDIAFEFRGLDRSASLPGKKHIAEKKTAIIQQQIAAMLKLTRLRTGEATKEIERERKETDEKTEQLARYRLQLQRLSLNIMDAEAKLYGRPPRYQQQYSYWQQENRTVPISLTRTERPDHSMVNNNAVIKRQAAISQYAPATREDYTAIALKDFSDDPEQNGLDRIATAPTQVATASGSYQHVGARGPVSNKSQDQEEEYQEPQDAQAVQNEGAGSHVKPVPDIALLDTPREILANSLDGKTRDAVIANHRDAMHRMLRVPSNDRISRTIMSPRISPDDATSFNGMDL